MVISMSINTHVLNLIFIILLSIYFSTKRKTLFQKGAFVYKLAFTSRVWVYSCIVIRLFN